MFMAILGFVLALFGGDAVLAGTVLHLIVALWIFLTYLLWVCDLSLTYFLGYMIFLKPKFFSRATTIFLGFSFRKSCVTI